jgi:hypothetical protein
MAYEVIPVTVEKYVMNGKEIAKFLNGKQRWYSYAERVPLPGEMIRKNNGETSVISDGASRYIRDEYFDSSKKHWRYTVLTRRNRYRMIYKVIWVNF